VHNGVIPLQSLVRRSLVVAPIRLALGGLGVGLALVAGSSTSAVLAFVGGGIGLLFVAMGDPRRRAFRLPDDPPTAPAGAPEDGVLRIAWSAVWPSTAGVTAILVAALFFQPALAAALAGILAGLGVAALAGAAELALLERRRGLRLFLVRGTGDVVARRSA
jgi:hypothetical protein